MYNSSIDNETDPELCLIEAQEDSESLRTNNLVNLIVCRLLGGCRPLPRTEHMGDAVQYSQVKCACGSGVPSPNTTTAASVPIAPYLRISIFAAMGTQLVRPMYLDSSHVDLGFVSRELRSP